MTTAMQPAASVPGLGLGASFAVAWAHLYTLGMAGPQRWRRIDQIASDIWEHRDDAFGEGRNGFTYNLEVLGRSLRGMPADITWRFQLEGPFMNINIPVERLAGAFFLLLIVAMALTISANGYDSSAEGFNDGGELQRLADVRTWQASVYSGLQVLAGVAMLLGAVVFAIHLHARAPLLSLASAVMLTSAGILTLVGAAIYMAATDLADEWAANPANGDAAATAARAMLVVLGGISMGLITCLGLAVYGLAIATARLGIMPRALKWVAVVSAVLFAVAFVCEVFDLDFLTWVIGSTAIILMCVWLAVAGFKLLLGAPSSSGLGTPIVTAPVTSA